MVNEERNEWINSAKRWCSKEFKSYLKDKRILENAEWISKWYNEYFDLEIISSGKMTPDLVINGVMCCTKEVKIHSENRRLVIDDLIDNPQRVYMHMVIENQRRNENCPHP